MAATIRESIHAAPHPPFDGLQNVGVDATRTGDGRLADR
jgi:hypothetical protein